LKVSCINKDELEKNHAYFRVELGDNIFEVFAISRFKNEKHYLLRFPNDNLRWFSSELFMVKDESIPQNGSLVSMNLNGDEYFYIRNAQGDINDIGHVSHYSYCVYPKFNSKLEKLYR